MSCKPLPAPGLDRHRALLLDLEEIAARLDVCVPEYEFYAQRLVNDARAMEYSDIAGPLEVLIAAAVILKRQDLAFAEGHPESEDFDFGGEA